MLSSRVISRIIRNKLNGIILNLFIFYCHIFFDFLLYWGVYIFYFAAYFSIGALFQLTFTFSLKNVVVIIIIICMPFSSLLQICINTHCRIHVCLLSWIQVNLVWKSGPSGVHVQLLVVKGRRCEPELVYHLTGHTAAAL